MSERDEMITKAKEYIAYHNLKTAYSDEAELFADFALQAERDLRDALVAELEKEHLTGFGSQDYRHGLMVALRIVRGGKDGK